MRNAFKAIIAASALAATSLAVVQPAQARDHTGAAIVAGIVGLGVGAAIASNYQRYEPAGYYQDYPQGAYYAPQPVYYAQPYGYAGYGNGYGYDYGYDYGRPQYRQDHWRGDRGRRDYDRRDHDRRDDRRGR